MFGPVSNQSVHSSRWAGVQVLVSVPMITTRMAAIAPKAASARHQRRTAGRWYYEVCKDVSYPSLKDVGFTLALPADERLASE